MLQTVAAVVTPLRDVETVDVDLAGITACGSSCFCAAAVAAATDSAETTTACGSSCSCAAAAALVADTMIVAANYR